MTHPLVLQLNYAKQRWLDGHENLNEADANTRLGHGNSIGWMVGHLAHFDQWAWLEMTQGRIVTDAVKVCNFGLPACTPSLKEMMSAWQAIDAEVRPFLEALTEEDMGTILYIRRENKPPHPFEPYSVVIQRQTWHYWYHLGEMQAFRQAMGHENLPQFVDRKIPLEVQYSSETWRGKNGA